MLYGALEAGGTKMVLAVGDENFNIIDTIQIPTLEDAKATMQQMIDWFKKYDIVSLGIATFGPVDLHKDSPTYGYITSTPKPGWHNYPMLPEFKQALNVPVGFDTDVNGAALAEWKLGAAKGLSGCLYVTIGTGIGGGLVLENNLVHGMLHPEFGHMLLRGNRYDPCPDGFCPYHKGCLEGYATGPAIEKRWGKSAKVLPDNHPAWELESFYLAQMCVNAIMAFSPEKIVLGGGVMNKSFLFPLIRKKTVELLNGYVQMPQILEDIDNYIVSPGLGTKSGITGAFLLAEEAYKG